MVAPARPLRTILVPAFDRSQDLADKICGLLGIQINVTIGMPVAVLVGLFTAIMGMAILGSLVILGLALTSIVVAVVFVVRFAQWIFNTVHTSRAFGLRPMSIPPAVAVVLLFVPVVNFFWFYGVLALFWWASEPRLLQLKPGEKQPDSFTWTPIVLMVGTVFNVFLSLFNIVLISVAPLLGLFVSVISLIISICLLMSLRSVIENTSSRFAAQYDQLRRQPVDAPATLPAGVGVAAS